MKKSEAKMVLVIMASENEVSIESVLSVVDMIDDLETDERTARRPLLPIPKNLERQYGKVASQPLSEEETKEAIEQLDRQKAEEETLKALDDRCQKKDPENRPEPKDCCKNCAYGLRGEMTWEDGTKHPGRKCRKDGRTHSDDGYCCNYSRRGRKTKEET